MSVRVRLAPSPTGSPHIGTAWQALFDFAFAKKNGGVFILRLEDTDQARLVPESIDEIKETLSWLGFDYDEGPDKDGGFGPYTQSARIEIYQKYAKELVEKELAYQDEGAIRFRINKEGATTYHDLVGEKDITIENSTQEDFVILKSDGFPTYNFANVIDDHLMEISHVIRGNEYISSMPKYLQLYKAFDWSPPQFAHLPLLVGSDRSKLSKRHGAKGALEFRKEGYLKEALVNFLALLGWSHPEGREIFSLEEMIEVFDFKDFRDVNAYFDTTKLDWLNGEYIRRMTDEELTLRLEDYLVDHPNKEKIKEIVPLVKERIKKLSDFIFLTDFIFNQPEYDLGEFKLSKLPESEEEVKAIFTKMVTILEEMQKPWDTKIFEEKFRKLADDLVLPAGDIFQLVRIAVSGQKVTPPLFESIEIMGEDEAIRRVKYVAETYPNFTDETADSNMETDNE